MFKCYICGKEYDTPVEAANCTISCNDRLKEIKELEELKCSITNSFEDLQELCREYSERNSDTNIYITFHSEPKESNKQKKAMESINRQTKINRQEFPNIVELLNDIFYGGELK